MRVYLRRYLHQTIEIRATVTSAGINRKNKNQMCLVLTNLKHNIFGDYLCDHAWIRVGKNMFKEQREINRGDVIRFCAKIRQYKKKNGGIDYGLFYPSRIRIVNRDRRMIREKILEKILTEEDLCLT